MPISRVADSWLKTLIDHRLSPREVCDTLINLGIETEIHENLFERFDGFVVGEVVTKTAHDNAEKLSVCTVDVGGSEPLTIVCGAPNVAAGQKVPVALIGTTMPSGDFTIEKRKIRGVASEGMICSEVELGIGDDASGILVLPNTYKVGTPLGELYGDVIYEVDITANRGDCLSHLGIARELAAVTSGEVRFPSTALREIDAPTSDAIAVTIESPRLCHRYAARIVRNVSIGPSPAWLRRRIEALGVRSINNVVDVASLVMFECGHPLHAFDYDAVDERRIIVRQATEGESIVTLDGKDRNLPAGALLICDPTKPIAVAGVMGGENSEITVSSTSVLIESAWFDPSSIRKTARSLGLSTDASYRFERGADIGIIEYAVDRAASLIAEVAGGEILTGIVDVYPDKRNRRSIELRYDCTDAILGVSIPSDEQLSTLNRLGFDLLDEHDVSVQIKPPTWRTDVSSEIDLIEEIARLHGLDRIPEDGTINLSHTREAYTIESLIDRARTILLDNGISEMVSPYLTDPDSAGRYASSGGAVALVNGLGRETSFMRSSLLPSAAEAIAHNARHSQSDLRLFEIGKAFRHGRSDQGVIPGIVEVVELGIALSGRAEPSSWDLPSRESDLFDLRGLIDRFLAALHYPEPTYNQVSDEQWGFGAPSLSIWIGGVEIGRIGPFDQWIVDRFELTGKPVVAVIDLERLFHLEREQKKYRKPSKYPTVERDISLLVGSATTNDAIVSTIRETGRPLLRSVELFDIYAGKGIPEGKKSMSYRLTFGSDDRTLEEKDIETILGTILSRLGVDFGASLRV